MSLPNILPRLVSRLSSRILAAALVVLTVGGFSPLGIFGALVPKDAGVAVVSDVAYGEHPRQRLDVYRPDGEAVGLPVVLFFYGGSWNSGDKAEYAFVGHALAAQGFVTVIADYRLVPDVSYPAFVEDGAAALAWTARAISAYGGDPARIAVAGHSAGAYNAVMLALDTSSARAAGYSGDLRAVAGLSGPYDFLPLDDASTIAAFGAVADLPATQPMAHATADAPPALLLHGEDDTLVYPRNSVALSQALTEAGADVALKIYPGIDHAGTLLALSRWFRDDSTVFADLVAFLRENV